MGDDPRGFIISLDLLFAIIPLTIVLGMVSADMGNILYDIEDAVYRSSTDRVAEDTMNTLADTSGDPYNWEQTGTVNIVGLAKYDTSKGKPIPGNIDPNKLALITTTNIQNIIGNNNYGFNITITTHNGTVLNPPLGINAPSNTKDIVRVDKVVLCSKLNSVTSIISQIKYSGQTRTYTVPSFSTSNFTISKYDYYILFVNTGGNANSNATVTINSNTIILNSTSIFTAQNINSTMLQTNSSTPNTVTLNVTTSNIGDSMDFYIVQAPKNTDKNYVNYNNVVPQNCTLTLYLWTT
jgi:hypothetical protein